VHCPCAERGEGKARKKARWRGTYFRHTSSDDHRPAMVNLDSIRKVFFFSFHRPRHSALSHSTYVKPYLDQNLRAKNKKCNKSLFHDADPTFPFLFPYHDFVPLCYVFCRLQCFILVQKLQCVLIKLFCSEKLRFFGP
jgi:hypothetical protein